MITLNNGRGENSDTSLQHSILANVSQSCEKGCFWNKFEKQMCVTAIKLSNTNSSNKKRWQKRKEMSTTPGIPRRSPIQVLTGLDVA